MQILTNPISTLNVSKLPKFSCLLGNQGWGTQWWFQILDRKWKYGRFAQAQWKLCNITLIYGRIAEIFESCRKSGLNNTTVMSDLCAEVEIRLYCASVIHPAVIIGTVRSLWAWLWGRYHVTQNVFLVIYNSTYTMKHVWIMNIFS